MPRARNDAFTRTNYNESLVSTVTTYYRGGGSSFSQNTWSQAEHSCVRQFKSTNRTRPIPGTLTPWLPISSYERGVMELSNNKGSWVDTKSFLKSDTISAKTVEGPPNTGAGLTMYWIYPIFKGSPYVNEDGELYDRVQTECLKKLGDNKAQLGAALAEARKTGNMLADAASTFFKVCLYAKRGNIRRAMYEAGLRNAKPTRELAENYLKLKYGVAPLMSDIYGLHSLFREQVQKALLLKANASVQDTATVDVNPTSGWKRYGSASRSVTCKLFARLDDTFSRDVNRVGLANPALIAWEVVPWSFIVDWGIPVANTLEAMTATHGLKFVGGFVSTRGEGKTTATLVASGNWEEISPRSIDVEYFGYVRVKLTSFPRAKFYAKNPFSTSHAVSAAALARVLFLR